MIWSIIRTAMRRADVKSLVELAGMTGIKPTTLYNKRRADPSGFRLYELRQIDKAVGFTMDEWALILRGTL